MSDDDNEIANKAGPASACSSSAAESSIESLTENVETNPTNFKAWRDLIELHLAQKNFSAARAAFESLLSNLPYEPWVLGLGLQVAMESGDAIQLARYRQHMTDLLDAWETAPALDDRANLHPSRKTTLLTDQAGTLAQSEMPRLRLLTGGGASVAEPTSTTSGVSIDDVVGYARVRSLLQEIRNDIEQTQPGGKDWLGGVLLYGPPNCGKSFAAEVLAGELNASLWSIDVSGSWETSTLRDVVGRAIDQSSARLALIHFENLDLVEQSRSGLALRSVISMLDDVAHRARVVVLGSAVMPWHVSSTLARPGRLGRVLLLLPPDPPARLFYANHRFRGRADIHDADIEWLVARTDGYSFGDLARLADVATAFAVETQGDFEHHPVPTITRDALRKARTEVAPTCAPWLDKAAHHAMMNAETGLYDDLLEYFRARANRM